MMHHLIFANIVTSADRQNLPRAHPIRRLIKPFSHGTPTVNLGAQMFLTTEYGLLHRALALDFEGLRTGLVAGFKVSRIKGKPMAKHAESLKELGDLDFPFAADGRDFYDVVYKYMLAYTKVYYHSDKELHADRDLANFWAAIRVFEDTSLPPWESTTIEDVAAQGASFVFSVTGLHHVVGNVAEYLISPEFASGRIRPGFQISDVESSMYGLLVAILTGMKAPKLMADYTHLLLPDEHLPKTTKIFLEFQEDLAALCKKIDARNEQRKWKFMGFHPSRLLTSISI